MKNQLHVSTKVDLSFNLRHFLPMKLIQTAEIIKKNGLLFQDFWRYAYLCNKYILKYAQILQSEPKSTILNIEGFPNMYVRRVYVRDMKISTKKSLGYTFLSELLVRL